MMTISVPTSKRVEFVEITSQIQSAIEKEKVKSGGCIVYVPHTTAGVTINENADPDVVRDMTLALGKIVPEHGDYRHSEGNSDSHIKSSIFGNSQYLIIDNGKIQLGTWQGVYFCEFDGPRNRQVWLQFIG